MTTVDEAINKLEEDIAPLVARGYTVLEAIALLKHGRDVVDDEQFMATVRA